MAKRKASSAGDVVRAWRVGGVGYVQLNRPTKANAYNHAVLDALEHHMEALASDSRVHVAVICGAGDRAFCAGADLDEMRGKDYRSALDLKSAAVFARIHTWPGVTLAAINGAAVGGGLELALACDIRIAASHARFFLPETAMGLMPAAGGTQRLPEIVGVARAKELILAGCVWGAEEALRFGLVSEVMKGAELLSTAQAWGERASKRDPLACRLAKQAIDAGAAGAGWATVAEALLYQVRPARKRLTRK